MEQKVIGIVFWTVLFVMSWAVSESMAVGLLVATVLTAPAWDPEIRQSLKDIWSKIR